jgi:negative elongation factor E
LDVPSATLIDNVGPSISCDSSTYDHLTAPCFQNCGFITFDKTEAAESAIAEFNGTVVGEIQLKVSMARRQPVIDPINDASSSATWSTIAASHSQKGSHKDKRELVAYDEDVF